MKINALSTNAENFMLLMIRITENNQFNRVSDMIVIVEKKIIMYKI